MEQHNHDIEIIIGLLVVVAAFAWLASRLRVPYPVLLVVAGLGIGFVPGLPSLELRPDLVFLLFLPPILYYAGLLTSWRDFRNNLRPISLLAIGLVLFTTFAVAGVAYYLVDGLTWPAACVLGAIVSPPDAVAATAILQRMRIPKRVITILEGESLVNDATAIVAYRIAVAAVVSNLTFSTWKAGLTVLAVGAGGVVVGWLVGWLVTWVRPRLRDPAVESTLSLLTPFIAYLPAEWAHVSGVLAAVTAGVYVGRRVPQITSSTQRLRLYGTWETVIFLINGVVFVLIGLQLPSIMGRLHAYSLPTLLGYAGAITLVAVVARLAWVWPATYVPRWLSPALARRNPIPEKGFTFLISWVGLRGIVSLAAALALPRTLKDGTPFPGRDLILFITFGVILATLVVQGLTLPLVIRGLGLKGDDEEANEETLARLEAAHAALARLEVLGFTNEDAADLIARVRQPYDQRVAYLSAVTGRTHPSGLPEDEVPSCRSTDEVIRYAITAEREMLINLRDAGTISDEVLRRIQTELDLEEAKLAANGHNRQ